MIWLNEHDLVGMYNVKYELLLNRLAEVSGKTQLIEFPESTMLLTHKEVNEELLFIYFLYGAPYNHLIFDQLKIENWFVLQSVCVLYIRLKL